MIHVSQVKAGLKDIYLSLLDAKLGEADAAVNNGVVTPKVFEIYTTERESLDGYPSLELIATSSRPLRDSHAQIYEHRVVVGFTLAGDNEATLTEQVERYMWSIRAISRDAYSSPDGPIGPVDAGIEQYTPLDKRQAGAEWPFVKGGYIELFVQTCE